jgi:hypothetical protein
MELENGGDSRRGAEAQSFLLELIVRFDLMVPERVGLMATLT